MHKKVCQSGPMYTVPAPGWQTWGELIVNSNALLMHYLFPVIQGND